MEPWQTAIMFTSFTALIAVGASLARENWDRLIHGSLVRSGGANLMADEWHLSDDARAAIRQALLVATGLFLAVEGLGFSLISIYSLIFS